jgi:hypothetical protein
MLLHLESLSCSVMHLKHSLYVTNDPLCGLRLLHNISRHVRKLVILLPYKIDRLSKPKLCFLFDLAGALSHLYFTFIDFYRLTFDTLDLSYIFQDLVFGIPLK